MNQRIRELAIEAGYTKDMAGIGHWDMPECKKFVELIIDECSQVCLARASQYQVNHLITDEAILCSIWIKKHFEIEGSIRLKAEFWDKE
jgi:hypothetical protein